MIIEMVKRISGGMQRGAPLEQNINLKAAFVS
jgi:hypothetical protein